MQFYSDSERGTEQIGALLAQSIPTHSFVALRGDLGAGKTAFVRGFAGALGSLDVHSPTFSIVHEYETTPPVFHFDVYRLRSADDLYDVSFDEYLGRDGIILMEWPQVVEGALPNSRIEVDIRKLSDTERQITITSLAGAILNRKGMGE